MPTPSQHAFAEKVALITDGANPFARAIALQLALYGSYVCLGFSQTNAEDERLLGELRSLGTLANAVEADLTGAAGARDLVSGVEQLYGRIDLLVNCVKITPDSVFVDTTEEFFDKTFDKGVKSPFFITREAFALMKNRPRPKIVNVISAADTPATETDVAAAAASQAVIGMTRSLARFLPENFRINAVSVSEREKPTAHFDKFSRSAPELFRENKGVDTDDVARTVLFLLSSEAVGVNGQLLKVK